MMKLKIQTLSKNFNPKYLFKFFSTNQPIEKIFTKEKIQDYKEKGYAVLPKVFSEETINELKIEISNLINNADINELKTKFEEDHPADEDYFLDSGDKVRIINIKFNR
jgi:hypothetical protein